MSDDIQAIEEWASIFARPGDLASTVAERLALHHKRFKEDLAQTEDDFAAGKWFAAGVDVSSVAVDLIGPIKPHYN